MYKSDLLPLTLFVFFQVASSSTHVEDMGIDVVEASTNPPGQRGEKGLFEHRKKPTLHTAKHSQKP